MVDALIVGNELTKKLVDGTVITVLSSIYIQQFGAYGLMNRT